MNRCIARSIVAFGALSITIAGSLNMAQMQPANAQAGRPQPRPELNGQLIRSADTGAIFWVENGLARYIPNMATFTRLFRNQINTAVNPNTVKFGIPIADYSILAKCNQSDAIFLLDRDQVDQGELMRGLKRHITSPAAFNQNRFNPNGVKTVGCPALNQMTSGAPIK
jgi:hypothetical protein